MKVVRVNIRPAMIGDAENMSTLFMRAWHISLKDIVPDGFLDQFEHKKQKEKYEERVTDPEWVIFIAELNGAIIGMVCARDHHIEPQTFQKEIRAMYVDPDFQRQGIGTLLLDKILSQLKQEQVRNAMLWCIQANDAACSFYQKHGGKRIENVTPPEEYSAMPHVIYAWNLDRHSVGT